MGMTTIYEIWQVVDAAGGTQIALLESGQFEARRDLYEGKAELLTSFEAQTYDEAAQKRNDYFGWGKYQPMD